MARTGNPVGRPKGSKNRTNIGRPLGEKGIMAQYRERMLNSPKSKKVLDSIFNAALDDDHKSQAAAWKLIVDRIVPVAGFEKEAVGTTRSAITVNISGVPGIDISAPQDIEGEHEVLIDE